MRVYEGGGHVHECVISSAKASYSAAGFLPCQVIWGFLFVLRCFFCTFVFKKNVLLRTGS